MSDASSVSPKAPVPQSSVSSQPKRKVSSSLQDDSFKKPKGVCKPKWSLRTVATSAIFISRIKNVVFFQKCYQDWLLDTPMIKEDGNEFNWVDLYNRRKTPIWEANKTQIAKWRQS